MQGLLEAVKEPREEIFGGEQAVIYQSPHNSHLIAEILNLTDNQVSMQSISQFM